MARRGAEPVLCGRTTAGPSQTSFLSVWQGHSGPLTDIPPLCVLRSGPVLGSPGQPPAPSGTSCSHEEGQGDPRKLQGKSQTGQAEPGHCLWPTESKPNLPRWGDPEPLLRTFKHGLLNVHSSSSTIYLHNSHSVCQRPRRHPHTLEGTASLGPFPPTYLQQEPFRGFSGPGL